jgi:integrase
MESQWEGKKEFTLGKTLPDAYRVWADRLAELEDITSVSDLMDRYLLEVVPTKSFKSQESNQLAIRRLKPVFGMMRPCEIQPVHAYKYADLATKAHGRTSAKHDIQCLSHLLTKAVEWGVMNRNPLLGQVRIKGTGPRDRLVEDWEIDEALAIKSNYRGVLIANVYIRFKLMTGLRRGDILRLKLSNLKEDGIHILLNKTKQSTGKRLIIEWDQEGDMRALSDEILRTPPRRIGDAPLFVTRQGKSYIDDQGRCNAFDSLWQRFIDKVMAETKVAERFQERDLRAKVASDSDSLIEASERLGHADKAITQRVYRRKPVRIQPLKKGRGT